MRLWAIIKDTGASWLDHKDARLGAALAYYSIFSIGPVLVIAMGVASIAFGEQAVRNEVTGQLRDLLGEAGAGAVDAMLTGANKPREGAWAALIGAGLLILAAIGVVVQLKDALNTVWDVPAARTAGWRNFVRTYVTSLASIMTLGFLLLVSLMFTTVLSASAKFVGPAFPEVAMQSVGSLVSLGFISLLFAMMFKWLPDAPVEWRDVWPGALLTAALFEAGKFAIGLYIGKQGLESTFGAAASLVALLIWVYYSAQIVLLGAEFTRAWAKHRRPRASDTGAPITDASAPSPHQA